VAAPRLDADGLYARAVQLLARRSRVEAELRRTLRPRAATAAALDAAIARLHEHHYLDDARVAEGFALYSREVARHGRGRVLRDLRARGVAAPVAEAAVTHGFAGSNEDTLLRAHLRAKRVRRPEDVRQAAGLYRRLLRAGFSPPACLRALRAWKLQPEWLEMLEAMEEEPESGGGME
jgi:regulatory protein